MDVASLLLLLALQVIGLAAIRSGVDANAMRRAFTSPRRWGSMRSGRGWPSTPRRPQ
jgi:hypothetical protein